MFEIFVNRGVLSPQNPPIVPVKSVGNTALNAPVTKDRRETCMEDLVFLLLSTQFIEAHTYNSKRTNLTKVPYGAFISCHHVIFQWHSFPLVLVYINCMMHSIMRNNYWNTSKLLFLLSKESIYEHNFLDHLKFSLQLPWVFYEEDNAYRGRSFGFTVDNR